MRNFNSEKLYNLQKNPNKIRNICILAHVDHGKTTLADSLVATNGIISAKMAGKLRYMDSRKDEQERGITMKSSSIALLHNLGEEDYMINLIDSPGHVDFSSEVSTAVRLCDGAIVIVDVVEGVCPQTKIALRQAWLENIRPVLVLNKIDRLIMEKQMSPLDAYVYLTQILEQVNAVMGEYFTMEVLGKLDVNKMENIEPNNEDSLYNWSTGLEDEDDSNLYFSPDHGNVVFASAIDGWGFGVEDFAKLYANKLGVSKTVLNKTLWGDYYLQSKTKRVMKGAMEKAKKPLFVQFVLENLWSVYDAIVVRRDKEKLTKIVESLNIKLTARDLRHTDGKVQLQAVCSQWMPLARTVLDMICKKLPSPCEMTEEKVEKLICSSSERFDNLPSETQKLKLAFLNCCSSEQSPLIVFISKMFPVERKHLPQNRPKPLTLEEINQRREQAKQRHVEKLNQDQNGHPLSTMIPDANGSNLIAQKYTKENVDESTKEESEEVFIAFARVFSGILKKGQEVYVLGPKHNPLVALERLKQGEEIDTRATVKDLKSGYYITKIVVNHLYLLMGRELESLEEVSAGNIVGIGGLDDHVLKTATLSTTVACPSFTELTLMVVPILRVAIEPVHPQDMATLTKGLRLLNQADACVQVIIQETGEHVLVTAGEVHLQRCLDDLKERYAKVEINVSEPIVPFRETVIEPPTVDMVNESILDQGPSVKKTDAQDDSTTNGVVTMWTANKQSMIKIRAAPLPAEITTLLETNNFLFRVLDKQFKVKSVDVQAVDEDKVTNSLIELELSEKAKSNLTEKTLQAIEDLKKKLEVMFKEAGPEWDGAVDQMWSVGPRRCGANILLNRVSNYKRPPMWTLIQTGNSPYLEYDSSFINGFQMATLAGPLCEEPMMGVCFIIEEWIVLDKPLADVLIETRQPYGPFSGQIMSVVKEGCRRAFQVQPQRLMMAMYSCNIQANAEVLGKMYAVLGRRHGRVLHGDVVEGSATFNITAVLPVVESFSFAPEIRKQTSGLASPQLVFSHWEVLDIDPFWTPNTEEEYLHYGEKADSGNTARKYMEVVRRRKGLAVEEKTVEFAEKQRTLSKNK
uniref:Ribosome assembly protein 1 n=1 Tax=Timema poppense TaxID=170557 RepID=A0A7R9CJ97_TIMPO|nr:unnamed protein product [Timema poppensis]